MNQPLDEKKLIEGIKLAKKMEQAARKMSEMATAIAYNYQSLAAGTYGLENQKRLCEILEVELPSETKREDTTATRNT